MVKSRRACTGFQLTVAIWRTELISARSISAVSNSSGSWYYKNSLGEYVNSVPNRCPYGGTPFLLYRQTVLWHNVPASFQLSFSRASNVPPFYGRTKEGATLSWKRSTTVLPTRIMNCFGGSVLPFHAKEFPGLL
jgi:hypothetical protein